MPVYREPPPPPPPPHHDYQAALDEKNRRQKKWVIAGGLFYVADIVFLAIQGAWLRVVLLALPPAALLVVLTWDHVRSGYARSGYAMNGWFSLKRAVTDAVIAGSMSLFALFWFGKVLGLSGSLGLIAAMFGLFQLLRYLNAQLATLEWARLQEAGRDEKKAVVAGPRGDGYRNAGEREAEPEADAWLYENEIPRRRKSARIGLGIVGVIAAVAALLPGIVFGAWFVPSVLGFIAALALCFFLGVRAMRKSEARKADFFMNHLAQDTRKLTTKEGAHVRVGVDFGVPQAQLRTDTEEPDEETEARRATR